MQTVGRLSQAPSFAVWFPPCLPMQTSLWLPMEGQATAEAGETDAAPGGLCTEVVPVRGTGVDSCGQQ